MVEDAPPVSTDQLEKGIYVLYKCTHGSQSGGANSSAAALSLSHSSTPTPTPTTPTSPDHSDLSSTHYANSTNTASQQSVRYRLGKIIDFKEKSKSFLVQPVCLSTATASASADGIASSDLVSAEWVKRLNLRLVAPPWFAEFKNELGLKSGREFNLSMILPPPPPPQPQPQPPAHAPTSISQPSTPLYSHRQLTNVDKPSKTIF